MTSEPPNFISASICVTAYPVLASSIKGQREAQKEKGRLGRPSSNQDELLYLVYRVDSISKPQASSKGSGMYLEFLFLRAHSRSRVDRKYWSGESLYSCTTCSNSVMVGVTGPIGSGLPQFGLPRRFAMNESFLLQDKDLIKSLPKFDSPEGP